MRPGTGSSRSAMVYRIAGPGATPGIFAAQELTPLCRFLDGPQDQTSDVQLHIVEISRFRVSLAASAAPESRSKFGPAVHYSATVGHATTAIHVGGNFGSWACGGRDYRTFGTGGLCRGCFHHRTQPSMYISMAQWRKPSLDPPGCGLDDIASTGRIMVLAAWRVDPEAHEALAENPQSQIDGQASNKARPRRQGAAGADVWNASG